MHEQGERDDDESEGEIFGDAAPRPMDTASQASPVAGREDSMYSPTPIPSPVTPRSEPPGDEDMVALLETMSGRPEARRRILRDSQEIMKIVRDLGGSRARYGRGRATAINRVLAEVYSAPRVTKVLKMMPSQDVLPGFALDLTVEDENGVAWDFTRKKGGKQPERRSLARSRYS